MRFFPHLLWLLGAVLLLIGLGDFSGASIPYQDPTPAMLANQRDEIERGEAVAGMGGLLFVGGIVWVLIRRRSPK